MTHPLSRIRGFFRDNPVTRLFNDALDGNVLAEYIVASLTGSALIVMWSFSFVATNAAITHSWPNVRATGPRPITGTTAPGRLVATPKHNTGTAVSAPPRTVDETPRRDGDFQHCLPGASIRETGSHARPASRRPADRSLAGGGGAGSAEGRGRGSQVLRAIVAAAGVTRCVPFHILAGLAEDESGWRADAVGTHGEVGLLQLKAGVARWCGIKDRRHPGQNADCGARYLAAQFARFGTWEMAVVAFKAGPESIPENIPASSWAFAQRALQRAEAYR